MEATDYKKILAEKDKQIKSLRQRLQESESECKKAKTYFYKAQSQTDQIYGKIRGLQVEGTFTYAKAYAGCFTPGDLDNIHDILETQFKEMRDSLDEAKDQQLKDRKKLRDWEDRLRNYTYDAREKLNYMYEKLMMVHGSNPRPRYHHFYDLEDLAKITDNLEKQFDEMLRLVDKTVLLKTSIDERIEDMATELHEQRLELERLARHSERIQNNATFNTYMRQFH